MSTIVNLSGSIDDLRLNGFINFIKGISLFPQGQLEKKNVDKSCEQDFKLQVSSNSSWDILLWKVIKIFIESCVFYII